MINSSMQSNLQFKSTCKHKRTQQQNSLMAFERRAKKKTNKTKRVSIVKDRDRGIERDRESFRRQNNSKNEKEKHETHIIYGDKLVQWVFHAACVTVVSKSVQWKNRMHGFYLYSNKG